MHLSEISQNITYPIVSHISGRRCAIIHCRMVLKLTEVCSPKLELRMSEALSWEYYNFLQTPVRDVVSILE